MIAVGSRSGVATSVWLAGGFFLLAVLAVVSLQNQIHASEQLKTRLANAHDELAAAGRPSQEDFPVLGTAKVNKGQTKTYQGSYLQLKYKYDYPSQWLQRDIKIQDKAVGTRVYSTASISEANTAPEGQGIVDVTPVQMSYIQSPDDFKKVLPGDILQQRQYTTPKKKRVVEFVIQAVDGQHKIAFVYSDDKYKTYIQISEPSLTQQADDAGQVIIDSLEVVK